MQLTNPNRNRSHSADNHLLRQKQSGDQHVLPEGEPELSPHRPHRLNREDMQKMEQPGTERDDSESS